jgi:hypothetical protein
MDGQGDACDPDPPPMTCGDQVATATRAKANVFIILDKSGSMDDNNKWTQATQALNQIATNLWDQLRFGFALFPGLGGGSCAAPSIQLAMGDHTAAEIQAAYAPASPGGYTPMRLALQTAFDGDWVSDPADPGDATRSKAVVFITDGQPNCAPNPSDDDTAANVAAQAARFFAIGVPVYVVGFGSGVDPAILDAVAMAGGTDAPGASLYYQANNGAELEMTLSDIGSMLVSCTLVLDSVPPDPTKIYVKVNGASIARDDPNGFTYDPATNTITVQGTTCDQLRGSAAPSFEVLFGCAGGGPIP